MNIHAEYTDSIVNKVCEDGPGKGAFAETTLQSRTPQLRTLGLKTTLVKGVPTLTSQHVVCRKGQILFPEQVGATLSALAKCGFDCWLGLSRRARRRRICSSYSLSRWSRSASR